VSGIEGLKPLGEWNQNLLVTSYTWSRGLRQRGEKDNGFEISVSKTVAAPLPVLYQAWADEKARSKWLKQSIVTRKATENRSMRITWTDGVTSLSVDFYTKGDSKSQVVVQHLKLAGAADAAKMKSFWGGKLDTLKSMLEK
jgi:hypothetical protein